MSTTVVAPVVTTLDGGHGDDDYCHRVRAGRLLCGRETDGVGPTHPYGEIVGGHCVGCGRPKCPDCLRMIEAGR